ncbi:uncharacterized protein METZ01_LOCUS279537 [marine metagenome]|uniref:Uncharacterized protein n=1 Tax=marine metagenome TaxID=408172 RepID=A0A382KT40_9ZZZZ
METESPPDKADLIRMKSGYDHKKVRSRLQATQTMKEIRDF